ncbi:MAG: CocE/NonD family hydrolase [Gordonia sp. (in: high G+C Gram-positive bacteria)]|uniref:CocE/NonD family hydrolase n=1 Tax=Gordonia sp. (in: high G+C Gram-positive bacteria) TaxID=84139 RepID=UPI0039E4B765
MSVHLDLDGHGPVPHGRFGHQREPGLTTPRYRDPSGGHRAAVWHEAVYGRKPYPRVHIDRNVTVTMSDGVRLRATVVRPADRLGQASRAPFPAILNVNPYNRAVLDGFDFSLHGPGIGRIVRGAAGTMTHEKGPLTGISRLTRTFDRGLFDVFGINRNLVQAGYVQVLVDVRGTGASHGKWEILSAREQQDSVELIEWTAAQRWCDGSVGMVGWSYSAINSLQAAALRPKALKAIFAVEGSQDVVRDIYITGGMPSAFIPMWLAMVNAVKWAPNPATVLSDLFTGDFYRWARDRVKSPATEMPSLLWGFLTARDHRIFDHPYFIERSPQIADIEAATFTVGAWHDLFGRSATGIYDQLQMEPGRKQMLVADGYHLDPGCDHGGAHQPPQLDVLERAWFDRWLKDVRNGVEEYGPVTMEQQGGQWSCSDVFPRAEVRTRRLFLTPDSSGTAEHARHDGGLGLEPDLRVHSFKTHPDLRGMLSRDASQVFAGLPIALGRKFSHDASFQERGALSFTSEAVARPTQISGSMNLRLNVSTDAHEGIWAVTVNDVAPDGTSTVLTNGALTVSNRALDVSRSTYSEEGALLDAVHYLSRERRLPVPADEPVRIDVDLVATDAVLKTGHRLRVDVYAASLPRYLTIVPDLIKARGRRQHLVLDPNKPSYLTFQSDGDLGTEPVPARTQLHPV